MRNHPPPTPHFHSFCRAARGRCKHFYRHEKHADTLAFVINPEFLCHAWTWIHRAGIKPSSGLIGIVMAIKMCKLPVNVYGFQYDGYFNHDLRPHYYDWERPKKGREHVHPFRQESELFQRLMDARLLRLY